MIGNLKILLLGVMSIALCGFAISATPPETRIVTVNKRQIALILSNGSAKNLTQGDNVKYQPTWSPDGSMIAYLEMTPPSVAMSRLVIMRTDGSVIDQMLVHPAGNPASETGLRYLETMMWGGNNKVLLGGEINPSTAEYIEFQLGKPQAINDYMADGFQVAYSPDGAHLAMVSGAVHWALDSAPSSQLSVDGKPVASLAKQHVEFVSKPTWSPDGKTLAIVLKDPKADNASIFIRQAGHSEKTIPMTYTEDSRTELSWDRDGNLYAVVNPPGQLSTSSNAYWVKPSIAKLQAVQLNAIPAIQLDDEKSQLKQALTAKGFVEPDIWQRDPASPAGNLHP